MVTEPHHIKMIAVEPAAEEPSVGGEFVVVTPARADQRIRVLLVEDDDADAFLVSELLADVPDQVVVNRVRTLAEALGAPVTVDCVLLDLQLPDAEGLTGLTQLRQHAPGTALLVLTGQRDEAVGLAAVAAGAQDYLLKDQVDGLLLVKALRYAWERKRAEEAERRLLEQQLLAAENRRLERG